MQGTGQRRCVYLAAFATTCCSVLALATGPDISATSGGPRLDPSFGAGGTTDSLTIDLTPPINIRTFSGGLAVGSRGPVAAGLGDTRVEGLTMIGAVDAGFGTNGFADLPAGFSASKVFALSDGHILVVGTAFNASLVDLDATGHVDPAIHGGAPFAATGNILDVGARPEGGFNLVESGISGDLFIAAYDANAAPIASFGVAGSVALAVSPATGTPTGRVAFAPDGSFIVVSSLSGHAFLTSYFAAGSIVPTFGVGGTVDIGNLTVTAIAVLEDGVAVSGRSSLAQDNVRRVLLDRHGVNLNSTFTGFVVIGDCLYGARTDWNIVPRPGGGAIFVGDILMGGSCAGNRTFLELYKSDGQLDTRFHQLGLFLIDGHSALYPALDHLGRLYVAGRTSFDLNVHAPARVTRVDDVDFRTFGSLVSARLMETRNGPGLLTVDHLFEGIGVRAGQSTTGVAVRDRGGVSFNADAVVLNVTAVDPQGSGFLTVYPCGSERPVASSLNFTVGQTVANAVITKVGPTGDVCVYTLAATDVVIDVNGYFPAGSSFGPLLPGRIVETRTGPGLVTVDHLLEGIGTRPAQSTTDVSVTNRAGVPSNADAVVLNVTAINPQGSGFLTVYPCGSERPVASSLNYTTGQTVPNEVITKLGAAGDVCIYTLTATDLVIDVNGYLPAGSSYSSIVPARLVETRTGPGLVTVDHVQERIGTRPAQSTTDVIVTSRAAVPFGADAVVLNVTAVNPQGSGFLTVYPCGSERPLASSVNYTAGLTVANAVISKLGPTGTVCVYTLAATELIIDVSGYFL